MENDLIVIILTEIISLPCSLPSVGIQAYQARPLETWQSTFPCVYAQYAGSHLSLLCGLCVEPLPLKGGTLPTFSLFFSSSLSSHLSSLCLSLSPLFHEATLCPLSLFPLSLPTTIKLSTFALASIPLLSLSPPPPSLSFLACFKL